MNHLQILISKYSSNLFPSQVKIVETGPRDGLQSESSFICTSLKIDLINRLSTCGYSSIESTSFVSPKWVPQLSDHSEVFKSILKPVNISYPVLVPNMIGYSKAHSIGVSEISIFVSASEGFSRKNLNCSIDESLLRISKNDNIQVRAYISCVFSCPYDGETSPIQVRSLCKRLLALGCYEISLGDTIGTGTPETTRALFECLLEEIDPNVFAVHFHNTYNNAFENILTALTMGITVIDSSIAGLGGCPYAPGAPGNVSTEDLVFLLERLGIKTGLDLSELCEIAKWFSEATQIPNRSLVNTANMNLLINF